MQSIGKRRRRPTVVEELIGRRMQVDCLGAESSITEVDGSPFVGEFPFMPRQRRRQHQCRSFATAWAVMLLMGKSSAYSTPATTRQQLPRTCRLSSQPSPLWMNAPQPSTMFIETTGTKALSLSSLFAPSPPHSNRFVTLGNHHIDKHHQSHGMQQHRGVLGFHINPDTVDGGSDTTTTSTTTRLEAQREGSSSVAANLDTWNLARPLELDSPFLFPFDSSFYKDNLPGQPLTPERISALTVVQLKVELGKRGLKKTGNKADLQQRLLLDISESDDLTDLQRAYGTTTANSLAEWARTVDLEPLMRRRETIHREKLQGKRKETSKTKPSVDTSIIPEDYRSVLKKAFDQPSSPYSNREVKQMYAAAKVADQMGDPELCMRILLELKRATPHDARLYRRLSRLEKERGNVRAARAFLQEGLELQPDNAYLWSGLGQLEGSIGDIQKQKECLRRAIELDPTIPNSHHALGTLEHTGGEIAKAMQILKRGIEYCPKNHRLHHALGDLYRDAKMLDMAEKSYRKSLLYGPPVSHGFAYTALSYVAYEQDKARTCRHWLHRAVESGRNANGWVALAQFEESQGDVDAARNACVTAITAYERGLLKRARTFSQPVGPTKDDERSKRHRVDDDPVELKNKILQRAPSFRSGDRFYNVYRNWMRLEERHGSTEAFAAVYERASAAFPKQWKLSIDAAQYFARQGFSERARRCFSEACGRAESRHADPFRLFAAYEMSRGNHDLARQILYMGALNLADNKESDFGNRRGLAELFYTWGICEWQMNCLPQASSLFAHALEELASSGDSACQFRSFLLFVIARFEVSRHEYLRAQHFIGLCLRENKVPGGNAQVWKLWERIALEHGDDRLALRCQSQARTSAMEKSSATMQVASSLQSPELKSLVRRDPWHHLLFGSSGVGGAVVDPQLYSTSILPDNEHAEKEWGVVAAVDDDVASLNCSLR